ncbi:MAG: glycoside hydrolase family 13 protein [Streptosporangiales bacterium]
MVAGGEEWWRDAVVYQVYPRSFADADGDGVGDIPGIVERLDYLVRLGVDALWLTPFQTSPQADHGYDVSDYCDVDPLFGTLDDVDKLLVAAHDAGLRLIVDLVPNHCSREHPAFRAALAAPPGSAERERFHFRPGRGPGGDEPPNNWPSEFGGPAWTRVTEADGEPGEWYLHLYAPEQPDWNWDNPATNRFFADVLGFWFDLGVDGIRIDVAHGLHKAPGLPDVPDPSKVRPYTSRTNPYTSDREETHDVYRGWRKLANSYDPPRVLVGEVNLAPNRAALYTRPGELHQSFAFALTQTPWNARSWHSVMDDLLREGDRYGAPVTWVLESHDIVRASTRFGGGDAGFSRARAGLLAILALPGSAYIYQGEELGLPEVDVSEEDRQDPAWLRGGTSRDGCRVPLPWTEAAAGAYGFSSGGRVRPWLPQPDGWGVYSVEAAERAQDSTLALTRTALRLRRGLRASGVLGRGAGHARSISWLELGVDVLAFQRGSSFACVVNFRATPAPLPAGDVLLASELGVVDELPPDSACWLRLSNHA